jgi:hypothetical protein
MGHPKLPTEVRRRPQTAQCLADCAVAVQTFGLQRGDRVLEMIGQLRADFGDIGRREGKLAGHSIEVCGYLGRDVSAELSRSCVGIGPGAESALAPADQPDRRDEQPAQNYDVTEEGGHRSAPPTARAMP